MAIFNSFLYVYQGEIIVAAGWWVVELFIFNAWETALHIGQVVPE